MYGPVELHHQGLSRSQGRMSREVPNIVPEMNSLSTQLSSGAANLAVLPGGQGMKDSGTPVDQVSEVKEVTPFAEAHTTGKPKESAL